jgi:pimeloyl-ACP methyl ester carboxylesterase
MSVVVLNQSVIHYESLGRGRPVLFLHTWVGSWRYWVACLQAAAASHSAYAVDLYGFGDSARDPLLYSMDSQAALIGSFMDEMGIERIALVAHGLGALVGLHFAGLHPQRIARLLAVGLPVDSVSPPELLLDRDPNELHALLDGKGLHSAALLPETNSIDPAAMRLIPESAKINHTVSALQDSGMAVLIINGATDPLQQAAGPQRLSELGPHVHEIVFPESGHFPMLDAADAFQRLMIDFLTLETGTSPRELRLKEEWRRRVR